MSLWCRYVVHTVVSRASFVLHRYCVTSLLCHVGMHTTMAVRRSSLIDAVAARWYLVGDGCTSLGLTGLDLVHQDLEGAYLQVLSLVVTH